MKSHNPQGHYWGSAGNYDIIDCPTCSVDSSARKQAGFDRYQAMTMRRIGLEPVAHQRYAYALAEDFVQDPKGFLVLLGDVGGGKTVLATEMAWQLRENGRAVLWINEYDLFRILREAIASSTAGEEIGHAGYLGMRMREAPVLVIDDYGKQKSSEWTEQEMYGLIESRSRDHLPTIITSNVAPDDMVAPIRSRILAHDNSRIAYMPDTDMRIMVGQPMTRPKYLKVGGAPLLCTTCRCRPCPAPCPRAQVYIPDSVVF